MCARRCRPTVGLFLAGIALAGASCSEREPLPADVGWSLLARLPDDVFRQRGFLVPDPIAQWGDAGRLDWDDATRPLSWVINKNPEREPFVWTVARVARLELVAGPPKARTLRLRLAGAPTLEDPHAETELEVRLNDVVVDRVVLGTEPTDVVIATPTEAWLEGRNQLALEVPELRRAYRDDIGALGVALYRLEYDTPLAPVVEPRSSTLELLAGTYVEYVLEQAAPLDLDVVADASGAGELRLVVTRVDPGTALEIETLDDLEFDVTTEGVQRRIPLPSAEGDLLRVRLSWRSAASARLDFERLDVLYRSAAERAPVIYILVDTLAAQNMSVFGYGRETTPNLARLAADAVLFEHCVSNAPWTIPSAMSTMTGLYSLAHEAPVDSRSPDPALWRHWYLDEDRWTLAEAFRAGGWTTAGFVDAVWLTDRFRFDQGFERYDASAAQREKLDLDGGIRLVSRLALDWIDRRGQSPFFLFLHCLDVHGPYAADGRFDGALEGDALRTDRNLRFAGGVVNAYDTIPRYITRARYADGETPERLPTGPIVASYDEGVAMTDAELGKLFDALKSRGIYDRAILVLTADHGETMDESRHLFGHSVLEDECLHIPLMIKLPRSEGGGRRIAQTVQSVDIYPTLLDLAGLPHARSYLSGRSLAPLLRGASLPDAPTLSEHGLMVQSAVHFGGWKLLYAEPATTFKDTTLLTHPSVPADWLREHFPELLEHPMTAELAAQFAKREGYAERVAELRIILADPIVELYHIADDPEELHDLAASEPEKVTELLRVREELIAQRERARALTSTSRPTVELSEEDLGRLRDLGYVGD